MLNLLAAAGFLACALLILLRSVHMYQLCSYQNPSYKKYLGENRGEAFSAKRLVPLCAMACALIMPGLAAAPLYLCGLCVFAAVNLPPKGKKPLVYTPRVKRLLGTACVLLLPCFWLLCSLPWLSGGLLVARGTYMFFRLLGGGALRRNHPWLPLYPHGLCRLERPA